MKTLITILLLIVSLNCAAQTVTGKVKQMYNPIILSDYPEFINFERIIQHEKDVQDILEYVKVITTQAQIYQQTNLILLFKLDSIQKKIESQLQRIINKQVNDSLDLVRTLNLIDYPSYPRLQD